MASPDFYESACRSAKAAEVRALMADLSKQAQERERLLAEFTEQVVVNRTRREGKQPKLSKAAKEWLGDADEDARKAKEGLAQLIAQLSDEQLVGQALLDWDFAIQLHHPTVYHEDDRAFAERIDRHNKEALRLIKNFYRARGMPIPTLDRGGGITFTTAFKRAIPDLGTLGADCMAMEPALAALDQVAQRAKLPPLSQFVNHDPQGLSGKKPEWFSPAVGLATIRGLLDELGRSARTVKNAKKVVEELRTLENDLVQAERNKVQFHFVMLDLD